MTVVIDHAQDDRVFQQSATPLVVRQQVGVVRLLVVRFLVVRLLVVRQQNDHQLRWGYQSF